MTKCRGCGTILQLDDPEKIGYTPKEGSEYCQRCFRLIHYDDLTISMRTGIDPAVVFRQIHNMNALYLWVVDLFDFESGMIPSLKEELAGRDILMVCAKRDILPESLGEEKIARFVFARLKELGIQIKGLVITSKLMKDGVQEVKHAVEMLYQNRPVVVIGRANSGKSTLLNLLLGKNVLTSSRYPGTTLELNEIGIDGIQYIDTPGIEIQNSILMAVDESSLKSILPYKTIKPLVYQLRGDQSFAIGGLVRIDLLECDHASCVLYISDKLNVHRCKASFADELWQKHYKKLFSPVALNETFETVSTRKNIHHMDIVIDGLGWASISGQVSDVIVKAPSGVNITFRKAML